MEDTLTKNQLYYIRHRETIRQYYREWYQKNKDKEEFKNRVKENFKAWREENPEHYRFMNFIYYHNNVEKIRENQIEYRNKKKLIKQHFDPTIVSAQRNVSLSFD